jgi:cell wall-associated NlpC family hydrolase
VQVPGLSSQVAGQLATLEAQISQTGARLDALNESSLKMTADLAALQAHTEAAQAMVAAAQANLEDARLALRHQALVDYMDDAAPNGLVDMFAGATTTAAMEEYRALAAGNETAVIARYKAVSRRVTVEATTLLQDESSLHAALDQLAADRQNALATLTAQQVALAALDGQAGPLGSAFAAVQEAGTAVVKAVTMPGNPAASSIPAAVITALTDAASQLSVPYVWGAQTPGPGPGAGFDCSGLVQWAYGAAGVTLPRTAAEQYLAVSSVPSAQLRPGDLVFWNDGTTEVQHVAIYVGDGLVLQAPATGLVVSYSPIWPDGLVGFGRPD